MDSKREFRKNVEKMGMGHSKRRFNLCSGGSGNKENYGKGTGGLQKL